MPAAKPGIVVPERTSRTTKRKWERKFDVLEAARIRAHEDYLVGIAEACEDGLTQSDIAYILGNVHASSVGKYRDLGNEIREQRRSGSTS